MHERERPGSGGTVDPFDRWDTAVPGAPLAPAVPMHSAARVTNAASVS